MGAVYRAFDRHEQRLVALKVLTESAPPGPQHPLAAEYDAWARLDHPNIVQALGMGVAACGPIAAGTPYLVLEHIDGAPVNRVMPAGSANGRQVESIARQALHALDHVHASGFLHRDLKPANVLVQSRHPRLKLTDFGLALPLGESRSVGTVSGSLPYVSPEALLGLPLDGRADLYGLGILLYQLMTGKLPVRGGGPREILRWHLGGEPADPARTRPDLSPRLSAFVRRLTSRDRAERPASAVEALALLGSPRSGAPPHRPPRKIDRAARARLRLALDAARLGGARVLRLPAAAVRASALVGEVSVWAQIRGMRFHRLGGRSGDTRLTVTRLVLHALADYGDEAPTRARRFGLDAALPLRFVGGQAVLDASRLRDAPDGGGAAAEQRAARDIGRFLVASSRSRSIVLVVDRGGRRDPLLRGITRRLVQEAGRRADCNPARGGLLLLLA